MDKTKNAVGEDDSLQTLVTLEDLAEKKTKIYSRLLMDVSLAKEMETLSERHQKRRERLEKLLYGEIQTKKGAKEE